MAAGYAQTQVPAFSVGSIGMFNVQDGEQQRTHINLPITNISETEGIVKITMMAGRGRGRGMGGNAPDETENTY